MRIDYCQKCHKAGLKWKNPENIEDPQNYKYDVEVKWCPRCKQWVKTENHPYVGVHASRYL